MDLKQQILHLYRVDEMSLREIARKTGADRKTVRRLVQEYEASIKANPDTGIDEFLAAKPKYKTREYSPRVMRDAVAKEIDRCLKENERRRNNGMRKQCMKNTDIHRSLMEKGLRASYSGVCKYVRKKKSEKASKGKDVFLRIHREPGVECEFDWGEVKLFLGGEPTTLTMAVFCLPYSKGRMAYLYHRQDTLAFMESHRDFFHDCAGVPYMMVYDNMRVAVMFDEKEKKPTTALSRLSTFYKYNWRFCNARAGWEKGNVERSVDYVRGRAFTTRVDFDDLEEAQNWLRQVCIDMNAEKGSVATENKPEMLKEEIDAMQPYPGEIGCYELAEYKSDKQSTICIKTNHYSIPDNLAGQSVLVQLYSEKIVIFDKSHRKVAQHARNYGSNQWVVDINHYISTLMKKTSAIQYSEAFHQMPMSMQVIFHKYFKDNGKEFLLLVKYVRDNGIAYEDVVTAADLLRYRGLTTFTADHFKVAFDAMKEVGYTYKEEQKTDEFIEIETGSEDILSQLEKIIEKGTKLPE